MKTPRKPNRQRPPTADAPAVELIRSKIGALYTHEPDVRDELVNAKVVDHRPTKHQRFMHELSQSGKSLADIQTSWHNYYQALPDHEKHQVWDEFYKQHSKAGSAVTQPTSSVEHATEPYLSSHKKTNLTHQITHTKRAKHKRNLHSLIFGLGIGALVLLVLLFGLFNERFIAPFITPSRSVSSTPIIIDPNTTAVGPEAKIIIPKINAEIPVVYDEKSVDEKAIQNALERGVIHYATTPLPGELGNGAVFGHSSNNILNKGKYKFAFVLLKQLENGDTFILQKDGKRYVYRVYEKKVVKPTDFSVLGATSKPATFTLITCDPPGTSINRLVVVGEQISPDPNQNTASTVDKTTTAVTEGILPGNAESLWQRFKNWISS